MPRRRGDPPFRGGGHLRCSRYTPRVATRVRLLGPPALEVDGETRLLSGRKPWGVLAYLLLEEERPTRSRLTEQLWHEADDPLGALRWALHQVRRAVAPGTLRDEDGRLALTLSAPVAVDAAAVLSGDIDAAAAENLASAHLLEGIQFDDCPEFGGWLAVQRARTRSAVAESLRWAASLLAASDPARAAGLAQRAASFDPFDDSVHALVVDCLVRAGDRRAAREYAEHARRLYHEELSQGLPEAVEASLAEAHAASIGVADPRPLIELARARLPAGDYVGAIEAGRRAVQAASAAADPRAEGEAALELASVLIHSVRGRDHEAHALLRRVLEVAEVVGDGRMSLAGEQEIGYLHFLEADYGAAESALGRAVALAEDLGEPAAAGRALTIVGACRSDRTDYAGAAAVLADALDRLRAGGDERWPAFARSFLARVQLRAGAIDGAQSLAEQSTAETRRVGWVALLPWPMAMLGEAQLAGGDVRTASRTFAEAHVLGREIGDPCWEAMGLRGLALVAERDGDPDRAVHLLAEGVRCVQRLPDTYKWAEALLLFDLVARQPTADPVLHDRLRSLAARGPMPDLVPTSQLP